MEEKEAIKEKDSEGEKERGQQINGRYETLKKIREKVRFSWPMMSFSADMNFSCQVTFLFSFYVKIAL